MSLHEGVSDLSRLLFKSIPQSMSHSLVSIRAHDDRPTNRVSHKEQHEFSPIIEVLFPEQKPYFRIDKSNTDSLKDMK